MVQKEIFSTFKFLTKKTVQDVPWIAEWCFQAVMPNMSEMEQKQYFKALKSCLYRALLEQRAYVKKKVMKKLAVGTLLCHVVALLLFISHIYLFLEFFQSHSKEESFITEEALLSFREGQYCDAPTKIQE